MPGKIFRQKGDKSDSLRPPDLSPQHICISLHRPVVDLDSVFPVGPATRGEAGGNRVVAEPRCNGEYCSVARVVIAPENIQFRIFTYIQRGQLIVIAIQIRQCRVLAHVQRCQLVITAMYYLQGCTTAHIQQSQLIVVANQMPQQRILAYI